MDDPTIYNQITVKNIDIEDFVFSVNRETYLIRAGEVRIFPKFMVRPMLKHLVDKILIRRNPDGKLLRNQQMRDDLAAQIILKEEAYEKPHVPSDKEIVDDMNKPELDRVLAKNRSRMTDEETASQEVQEFEVTTVVKPAKVKKAEPIKPSVAKPETFDQIEAEQNAKDSIPVKVPSRQGMLDYAKSVLKMNITEPKTQRAFDAMSDEEMFKELGLDKEENLDELGIK